MSQDHAFPVAVVTGGSRGIGRACVAQLAKSGFDVVFSYASNESAARSVVAEVSQATGRTVVGIKSDAGSSTDCQALMDQTMERFGRLDALVNNAGITRDTLLVRMSDEDWESVIQTNLTGVFYLCRAAGKVMMKQRSGAIVNISSIVGIYGNAGQANYTASKAGLIAFSKTIARELGPRGIRVNVIAPGLIETDMTDNLPRKEELMNHIPLRRFGQGEDIARTVEFLITSAQYITGQVIQVDGGLVF